MCRGIRKPRELKVRCYAARMIKINEYFTESHVGIPIVDNLYVVGGSIGIQITGSKIRNYDCVYISIDVSRALCHSLALALISNL